MTTAITNYTTLKAAVISWMRNGDLSGDEDGMIQMAEAKLNRRLRARSMDSSESVPLAAGADFVAFPTRCAEVQSIKRLSGDRWEEITYLTSDELDEVYSSSAGTPCFYTVTDSIEFDQPAASAQTIQVRYWKALDIAADATNWVLTNASDVYLFGALLFAGGFVREDERLTTWKAIFDEGVDELNTSQARSGGNAATLVTEIAAVGGYDINTDR